MKSIARCLSSSVIGGSCLSRRMISAIESTLEALCQASKLQLRSSILQKSAYAGAQAMRMDLLQRAQRQRQRAAAIFTRHQWPRATRCCSQKAFGLGAQGFDVFHLERARVDAGPGAMSPRRRQVANRSVIRRVVDGDVIARLKETHLANPLSTHPRGGDVRYRAGREFQSRIGGIDALSQDRNTHRVQRSYLDLLANQPLHDVQIVNHQIKHDVDVQASRRELAYAMNLKIDGIVHMWPQSDKRGIEAFGVTDLQHRAAFLPRSDHAIRFFQRARDWFLNQHVNAGFEQAASDLTMRFGRHRQTHGVDFTNQRAPVGGHTRGILVGNPASLCLIKIADARKLPEPFRRQRGMSTRVLAAEMSYADDCGAKCHGLLFCIYDLGYH